MGHLKADVFISFTSKIVSIIIFWFVVVKYNLFKSKIQISCAHPKSNLGSGAGQEDDRWTKKNSVRTLKLLLQKSFTKQRNVLTSQVFVRLNVSDKMLVVETWLKRRICWLEVWGKITVNCKSQTCKKCRRYISWPHVLLKLKHKNI